MNELLDHYAALNFTVFGLLPNSKIPACKWRLAKRGSVDQWKAGFLGNIAIATGNASGVVVVDCDNQKAVEWVKANLTPTDFRVRTPHGMHFYYRGTNVRNAQKVAGRYDVRGEGGYVVAPPSVIDGCDYEWTDGPPTALSDLPEFKREWRPETPVIGLPSLDVGAAVLKRQKRARAYVAKMPGAVSGQNGHNDTFRVACVLMRHFGLTIEQAWPIMLEWNERCKPPWGEKALLHKLNDAGGVAK